MSKIYSSISRARTLTAEERADMKTAQRNADMMTPMLKLFSSEYANQVAYDCIQVHGGSGFMKEYKCERLYRDARILTIYEGTSQLQVVAAIRFVGNGSYLKRMEEYDSMPLDDELKPLLEDIYAIKEQYVKIVGIMTTPGYSSELYDFHARNVVEAAGYVIMSYLLLQDTNRCRCFKTSCENMISMAKVEVAKRLTAVETIGEDKINNYKM